MFKKSIIIFFLVSVVFSCTSALYAFSSIKVSTFTCSVRIFGGKPLITHTRIPDINMIGNTVKITANIDGANTGIWAWVSINNGTWQKNEMTIVPGTEGEYKGDYKYTIPKSSITETGTLKYGIMARYDSLDYNKVLVTTTTTSYLFSGSTFAIVNVSRITNQTLTDNGGTIIVNDGNPDDGETTIIIPAGAFSGGAITITQHDVNDTVTVPDNIEAFVLGKRPASVFEFEPATRFTKLVTIKMLYFDLDNDGIIDDTNIDETTLQAYYWDGKEWFLYGGIVDPVNNVLEFKVDHFSFYGLFSTNITADMYRPKRRIITPALRDGINDTVFFQALNGTDTTIKIFDVTGACIRTINSMPYEWDGKDDHGYIVESGVYIYQFRAELDGAKKLLSGMIAVAK